MWPYRADCKIPTIPLQNRIRPDKSELAEETFAFRISTFKYISLKNSCINVFMNRTSSKSLKVELFFSHLTAAASRIRSKGVILREKPLSSSFTLNNNVRPSWEENSVFHFFHFHSLKTPKFRSFKYTWRITIHTQLVSQFQSFDYFRGHVINFTISKSFKKPWRRFFEDKIQQFYYWKIQKWQILVKIAFGSL